MKEELELKLAELQGKLAAETNAGKKALIQAEIDAVELQIEALETSGAGDASQDASQVSIRVSHALQISAKAVLINNDFVVPLRNVVEKAYSTQPSTLHGKSITIEYSKDPAGRDIELPASNGRPARKLATITGVSGNERLEEKASELVMANVVQRQLDTIYGVK